MTDNCLNTCPFADEKQECFGECKTIKTIEILSDEQLERGKGSSLIIQEVE